MRNRIRAGVSAFAAIAFALAGAGCSFSVPMSSLQIEPEMTASIGKTGAPLGAALDDEDWRRAQAALSLAVDPQGSGQPVNWDNPSTKRRGSFVPTGNMVLVGDTVCRPFQAVTVDAAQGGDIRKDGQACRTGPGEWTIRELHTGSALSFSPSIDQPLPPKSAPMLLSTDRKL